MLAESQKSNLGQSVIQITKAKVIVEIFQDSLHSYTPFVRNSYLYKTAGIVQQRSAIGGIGVDPDPAQQQPQYENFQFKVPAVPKSSGGIRANVVVGGTAPPPLAKPPPHFMRPKQASRSAVSIQYPSNNPTQDHIYYQGRDSKLIKQLQFAGGLNAHF